MKVIVDCSQYRSAFEFVVEMRHTSDLDWWSSRQRGDVEYEVDYERGELRIRVFAWGLTQAPLVGVQ